MVIEEEEQGGRRKVITSDFALLELIRGIEGSKELGVDETCHRGGRRREGFKED